MRSITKLFAVACLAIALFVVPRAAHAAPVNPKCVAADAKWYIHLDLDAARPTAIYAQVLAAINEKTHLDEMAPQLKEMIGINPLIDISGVTIYNTSFEKDVAAILIYAKFDKQLLTNAVTGNPQYASEQYNDHTIQSWVDANDGKHKVGCIYDEGLVVLGDKPETVKNALDVLDGKKNASPALIKPPAAGSFISAAASLADSPDPNVSQLLSDAQPVSATAGEVDGNVVVSLDLTAKTPEQADQLSKVAEGFKAFVQLAGRQMPTAAELLREVQVKTDGTHVTATFKHDSKTLVDDLRQLKDENDARQAKADAAKAQN